MQRQRKARKRKSARHIAAYHKGITSTVIRLAIEALQQPRLIGGRRWGCTTIAETVARLSNGRAKQFSIRDWSNGRQRAPSWFVVVLKGELEKQIRHRQEILAKLAEYQPQDRGERSRKQAVLAREQMLAGIGAIGKRRRAREEALRRAEADARAALGQPQNITSAGPITETTGEKNADIKAAWKNCSS
jgi:hypothetical protein